MTADYYTILGVPPNARPDDIRQAYHEMLRRHDRDRNPDQAAQRQFQRIQAAYEVLSDPRRRAAYDRGAGVLNSPGAGDVVSPGAGDVVAAADNIFDLGEGSGNEDRSGTAAARARRSDCPSQEQLVAYNFGRLSREVLQRIAAHVETCSECLKTLSSIPEGKDRLVSRLADSHADEEFLDEPQCDQAVQQFEAIGSQAASSAGRKRIAELRLPRKLGRYQLLEELGRGGMGTVYLAEDTQLDRQVAIKIPHFRAVSQGNSAEHPPFLERFSREARAAAKIRHANLCPVYDVGEIDGFPYLSMAYIRGRSLAKLIKGKVSFSQQEVAQIVRKLALAVQEAHGHGVMHRDIKPSNVIIAQDGEPILTDFGLARRVEADAAKLTHFGVIVGTPAYMAPEQVDGDPDEVGPGSDIYSLGVVLYELLTGEVPFRGPLLSVVTQIGKDQPDPPSLHCANLDPALETICLKAMAKDRADRYQSAGEMAAALQRCLQGLSETTPADTAGRSRVPRIGGLRRRRLIRIAAVAVVALLFLAWMLGYLGRGEGVLLLKVNVPDVSVSIDGGQKFPIKSPDEAIPVSAGPHRLEVSKEGFYSQEQPFTVRRGERTVLMATLRKEVSAGGTAAGDLLRIFLNPTRDAGDKFGFSVAAVGDNVLIGAYQDDTDGKNAGIAYLFSGSSAARLLTFHNPKPAADDYFGTFVAATKDNVLVAAPQSFSGGSGFVCLFDSMSGRLLDRLQPPSPHAADGFGTSIAALGNTIFIGAYQDDTVATDAGAVYVFEFDGSNWKLRPGFLKHVPRANDRFGCSLVVAGNNLFVGATGDDQHGTDAGAVYLFDVSTGLKLRTFQNPSPVAGDVFGSSIAAVGGDVLVGADTDDTGAENAGVAYLFDGPTGELLQTFLNPTPAIDEHFGWSMAAVGKYVLISAPQDDTGAENAGAAYLFDPASGKLVEQFLNPSPAAHDHFGFCLSALGNNVLIGTRRAGNVYLFAGPDPAKDPTLDGAPTSGDRP